MSIYMSRAELEEISEGLITAYANKFSNRVIQSIDIEHFITEFLMLRIEYASFAEDDAGRIGFLADGATPLLVHQDGKILVLPLILVLAFVWMIVKTIVSLYEIAHGILFSLVVVFCILSIAVYGDWLQTGLLAILGFISFLILSVGIFGEVLLGELINGIWSF